MSIQCKICRNKTKFFLVKTRDKVKRKINLCKKCNFEFFKKSLNTSLLKNKLDESRLNYEGLEKLPKNQEFKNGIEQSKHYIKKYIGDISKKEKILEIGCSWGYFLYLLKKKNFKTYGVEISKIKSNFVNHKLKILCKNNLNEYIKNNIKFKKIFLFYVLEYIQNPLNFISELLKILDKKGEIIIITPNLKDPLKTVWKNQGFENFFYEKHAVNYFSKKSLERVCEKLKIKNYKIFTEQGYSILNHINWHLNNRPLSSKIVCADTLIDDVGDSLFKNIEKLHHKQAAKISNYLKLLNKKYKEILEKKNFGNQIHLIIKN